VKQVLTANVAPIVHLEEGAKHPPFAAARAPAKKTPNPGDIRSGGYVFTIAIPRRLSFRHDDVPASACLLPTLTFNFQARTMTARNDDMISKHNHYITIVI
jgi:hypothetical protein